MVRVTISSAVCKHYDECEYRNALCPAGVVRVLVAVLQSAERLEDEKTQALSVVSQLVTHPVIVQRLKVSPLLLSW